MNILLIVDDDHPTYMDEPLPFTRKNVRDVGINFADAHADVPLCGPARVSILTGMSINNHGVDVNATWDKFLASPLDLNNRTLATILDEAGYMTGHFGKYINGHGATDLNVPPGWDKWLETVGDGKDEPWMNEDGQRVDLVEGANNTTVAALAAADFITENWDTPWFVHYCPTTPHRPYTPDAPYSGMYDGDRRDVPSTNEPNEGKPRWMRELDPATGHQSEFEGKKEELRQMDQQAIKPLIMAIEMAGLLDDTLIIFTSDNGYHHAEHRLMRKDRPYWESAQVPFWVKGPGVAQGLTLPAFVTHLDLFPTILEAANVPVPWDQADGMSILPLLTGEQYEWRKRVLVSGSAAYGPESNPGGAREPSGNWWLLREGVKALILRENGFRELYWMPTDPYQMHNKASQADQVMVDRMVEYIHAIKESSGHARRALEVE